MAKELRARRITRSGNNLTGELAEYLFCRAFQWERAGNSFAGIDAKGLDGVKYQIKGRRGKSRQMGAIRDIDKGHFDFLAGVLFAEDYSVSRAALIPHEVVKDKAHYQSHTNSHIFLLHDDILKLPKVTDVTLKLREVRY